MRAADFRYVGSFEVDHDGADTAWGQGFTHRYVGGQLRFLTLNLRRNLVEFAPPAALGGAATVTGRWGNVFQGATWPVGNGNHVGIWWDQAAQRLWSTDAIDYPDDVQMMHTANIATRTLNGDGTIANLRRVSLAGVGARRVYGGCQATPSTWRSQWGFLPFLCGWGGYASRVAQGLSASLGPTAYGLPDPGSVANGTTFTTAQFKTYMEHPVQANDWYASGRPTSGDRGVRNSDVVNYFDLGDPRPNPSSPPSVAPLSSAQWLSPAPDGLGRWVWGDSFYNTGMAIDGPQSYGLAMVGCFSSGKAYYAYSTLNSDGRNFEIQVFDPAHLAEVASGARQPWNVKPSSRAVVSLPGLGSGSPTNQEAGCPMGATYDPVTRRAYVFGSWVVPEIRNRVYVFDVAGQ